MKNRFTMNSMAYFEYELIEIYYYLVKDKLILEDKIEITTDYLDL